MGVPVLEIWKVIMKNRSNDIKGYQTEKGTANHSLTTCWNMLGTDQRFKTRNTVMSL